MVRKGSTLTSVVLAVAGMGLAGAVGYMGVTGNTPCSLLGSCDGGSCSSATKTTLVANQESTCTKSGAIVETVAAKDGEATKSCCASKTLAAGDKSSCTKGSEAQVVQVAQTQTQTQAQPAARPRYYTDRHGRRIGYQKARILTMEERVAQAGTITRVANDVNKTPVPRASNPALPVINAAATDKAGASDEGAACCKNKGAAQIVNAAAVEKAGACDKGAACCKNKGAAQIVNAAATSQCTKTASACSSGLKVCTKSMAASQRVAVDLVGASMPIVVPAAFYQADAKIDRAALTEAGCCRSSLKNVSAKQLCNDAGKDCCEKGKEAAVVPAAAIEKACEKGADCCKNKGAAAVIPAAAVEKADASDEGAACCKNKGPASE